MKTHTLPFRTALLAALGAALAGCTTTLPLTPGTPGADRLNARAARAATTIVLTNGSQRDAVALAVGADSVRWTDRFGRPHALPTSAVREALLARSRALRGFGLGLLGGAVVGAGVGAAAEPSFIFSRGFNVMVGGGALGIVGGLAGLIIGVSRKERYVFQPAAPSTPTR